jgi:hypothetical protein
MGDTAPNDLSLARPSPHPYGVRPRRATSLGKKLNTELEALQQTYPEAAVELWCEDEHRVGLKPVLRRVYVPEGEVPIASVNWCFEWLWLNLEIRLKERKGKYPDRGNQRDLRKGNHRIVIKLLF